MSEPSAPLLPREFFMRDPVRVARALLGQRFVSTIGGKRTAGTIVETEAYLGPPDKAAHTYNHRRTPRVESMWQRGGTAYVYFTYGMHHCVNVVVGEAGSPKAVLIRALEPTEGLDAMYARRARARTDRDLCSGPAKLCEAMGIDLRHDGADLATPGPITLERLRRRAVASSGIVVTPRVGVDYAGEWARKPLRFYLAGNRFISRR